MKKLMKIASFFMAGVVSLFSPMTMNHGDAGCCAECACSYYLCFMISSITFDISGGIHSSNLIY